MVEIILGLLIYFIVGCICLYIILKTFYSLSERKKVYKEWFKSNPLLKILSIFLAPIAAVCFLIVALGSIVLNVVMSFVDNFN